MPKKPVTKEQEEARAAVLFIAKVTGVFILLFGLLMGDAVITASRANGLIIALVWDVVLAGVLLGAIQWVKGKIS